MDVLTLLLQLFLASFVVLLPIVVGGLAFRRLTKSTTSNAWIYAVTCLFAAITTAELLPWAFGLSPTSWVFFVLAAFCPAVWLGVITICDASRKGSYDVDFGDASKILFKSRNAAPAPLILNNPVRDVPIPVFTHKGPANTDSPALRPVTALKEHLTGKIPEKPVSIGEKSVLDVAREMRRNKSSQERRPKLLPSPSMHELPFIKSRSTP